MGELKHLGWRGLSRRKSGSELTEFALVFPVLALLLFGTIQWGLIFAARVTVRNATIIAARYATLKSANSLNASDAQDYAKQKVAPMLDPNNVTGVTVTKVTVGGTNAVSVALTYNLKLFIPWVVYGTSVSNGQIALSATTTMMNATSQL